MKIDDADKSDLSTTKRALASKLYQEELEKNDASTAHFKDIIDRYQWVLGCILFLLAAVIVSSWLHSRRMKRKQEATEHDREKMHAELTKATMELQRTNTLL